MNGILSSPFPVVNEPQTSGHRLRGTMPAMTIGSASDLSQFRVTLFVGPQQVQGKPFTHSTVYNVKKRSWKGGIQVAVELNQTQVDQLSGAVGFSQWLETALTVVPAEECASYHERAQDLLVQALYGASWICCCNPASLSRINVSPPTHSLPN